MAAEDIPQTQNAFWGGLFSVLGPKMSMNADNARKLKDMQANVYQSAILNGHLKPEEIDYALGQIKKIYNDPQSKAMLEKLQTGVQQHIQSQGQQGQGAPGQGGQPSGPTQYGLAGAGGAIPGGAVPGAGGASPGGTMMAQAALPPPVALQQPIGGGGQAPPSQTTGGGPLPPPQMPAPTLPSPAQVLQPPAGLTPGGVLAAGFPNPYKRADEVDIREHQHALEAAGATAKQAAELAREEGSKDFAIWYQRGKDIGLTDPRDLAEYAANQGKKLPPVARYNMQAGLAKRPGSDTSEPIWFDPRHPGLMYSKKTGEIMPEGTEPEEKPKKIWTMGEDGKTISILADPRTNKPVPGSENPNEIPPGYLVEHIHKGEFTFADENGNVFRVPTTSKTTPVLPSQRVNGSGTSTAPQAPAAVRPTASAGSATAPVGNITATGPGGARLIGKNKNPQQPIIDRAEVAMRSGVTVMRDLDTLPTQHPDWFGPVSGRWTDIKRRIGTAPQGVSDLLAEVHSVENFLPSLHGLRGKYPLEAWANILRDPLVNPAATKNAIRGALKAVEEYRKILVTRGSNPDLSVDQMLKEAVPSAEESNATEFVRDSSGRIVPKK